MNQNEYKKIAVVDIDGTLIQGQVQQGLIKFFYSKGELKLTYLLRLNFWFILYKLHITHNVERVFELGLEYLKGKPVNKIDDLVKDYINEIVRPKIFPKSFTLIKELKTEGYTIILLSTAINAVVCRIAELFSADDYLCTKLEVINGFYTGHISGNIVYGPTKITVLKDYFEDKAYSLSNVKAYADHESDLPMLRIVGKAYITNPDTHMLHMAHKEGIDIMELR